MFKNREYVGQMLGSAAIGVAVGMFIQKALSPSCLPQPETAGASAIRYEYVQAHPQATKLQIPSHCHNHKKHRHHSHSKSFSRSKRRREKTGDLSVSTNSLQKSQISASETDLQMTFPLIEPRDSSNINAENFHSDSGLESTANLSTECLPIKVEDGNDLSPSLEDLNSCREYLTNESTEYLPIKIANNSANSDSLLFDIAQKSEENYDDGTFNYSIIATCDTFDKDCDFQKTNKKELDSTNESQRENVGEKKDLCNQEFVNLPTFYGSKVLKSSISNESLQ